MTGHRIAEQRSSRCALLQLKWTWNSHVCMISFRRLWIGGRPSASFKAANGPALAWIRAVNIRESQMICEQVRIVLQALQILWWTSWLFRHSIIFLKVEKLLSPSTARTPESNYSQRNILTALSFLLATSLTAGQSSIASSILPTLVAPTPTSIGNASDIQTYPVCAQTCAKEIAPFLARTIPGCDANKIECACSAYYRSETAACEEVTCSDADYQTTQALAQQLCGPLYSNNSALSTSVASTIASATALSSTIVAGRDPRNLSSYPACAVSDLQFFSEALDRDPLIKHATYIF
ncbi:MAG: hypothetical protein L6R40_002693 [Gallowayella cf. fulva]|nr:MAG: hypothetical protein L6R40_002693 [Xanthomendoza cf. fulva]